MTEYLLPSSMAEGMGETRQTWARPTLIGMVAAALFMLVYLGIVGLASGSVSHALQQLRTDALMVGPLTAGLGLQIGLYAYYRQLQRDLRRARPALAATAAGTGTSTVTMVACCAHHVTDVLPFIGLTATAAFLTEFRTQFILAGIVSNLVGVAVILRLVLHTRRELRGACTL